MPRYPGGDYYLPPGTTAAPDTTIQSTPYNTFTADVETELNRQIDKDADQDAALGAISASAVAFTPTGDIAATTVQAAIVEVDAEMHAADAALAAADALKVLKAGDTMSGHLTLPTGPAAANAVRKDYVDAADTTLTTNANSRVLRAGDTMTGNLTTPESPTILTAGNVGTLEVCGGTSTWAVMSFHVHGVFATNFGLNQNGNFYFGGWSHGSNYYQVWSTRDFNYTPVNKGGDTMSGALTAPTIWANDSIVARGDSYAGYNNATYGIYRFGNNGTHYLVFDGSNYSFIGSGNLYCNNFNCGQIDSGGVVYSRGYAGLQGTGSGGGYGSIHNWFWDSTVSGIQAWVDVTFVGGVYLVSDYRTKKDVAELPSMWDTVKALRPISYTQQEFSPPVHLEKMAERQKAGEDAGGQLCVNDDRERWGFIAHELQETLLPSAATGEKDSYDTVQAPNPLTVIAALTKALQEAMARIEALEAKVP